MKKRGFTLVELLAVIAILAILVIIALPNVMKMFNRAKEQAFTTELKEIYKIAQQQWIADSMFSTKEQEYARVRGTNCGKSLDLTGRSELEYYIKINKSGSVIVYYATDGTYQYAYTGTGLKIEDIGDVVQISKITDENDIITISCNGGSGGESGGETYNDEFDGRYYYIAQANEFDTYEGIPNNVTKYNSYQSAVAASGKNIFLRIEVEGNYIVSTSIGIIKNGTVYYIDFYEDSHNIEDVLDSIFGSSNCESMMGGATYDEENDEWIAPAEYYYNCLAEGFEAHSEIMGDSLDYISIYQGSFSCYMRESAVYCR